MTTKASTRALRVGIVGLSQGASHGRIFQRYIKETEVIALCDLRENRLKAAAKDLGVRRQTQHYEDILRNSDVDLVCIAIGCPQHGRAVIAALEAGKHVLVEVPAVSLSLDEVRNMVWACERRGLKLQMCNQQRWHNVRRRTKKMVEDGHVGEIFYAEGEYLHCGYDKYTVGAREEAHDQVTEGYLRVDFDGMPKDDPPHWRLGFGGPAQETIAGGGGVFALDCIRWLVGEEFCEVTALGNRKSLPYRDADDFQVALFKTPSGAVVRVACSYMMIRPFSVAMSVYGTKGSIEADRFDRSKVWHSGNVRDYNATMKEIRCPEDQVTEKQARELGHGLATLKQDQDLVDAILQDRQPYINVYEAARSCAAAICALESARDGGRPVKIPSFYQRMT